MVALALFGLAPWGAAALLKTGRPAAQAASEAQVGAGDRMALDPHRRRSSRASRRRHW